MQLKFKQNSMLHVCTIFLENQMVKLTLNHKQKSETHVTKQDFITLCTIMRKMVLNVIQSHTKNTKKNVA